MNNIVIPELPELTFEETGHIYKLRGLEVPSVTTLMKPLSDTAYRDIDENVLAKAAFRGTSIHQSIENYLLFGVVDISSEFSLYFDAFMEWYKEYNPKVICTERKVYHKRLKYAGTSDLLCEIDGKVTLVDYKSSASVNDMLYRVQLEGYGRAWESHGVEIDDKMVLHLKKNGRYKTHHYERSTEAYEVLTSLIKIRNYTGQYGGR